MPKSVMIEGLLELGCISVERAEVLLESHYDDVESEWLHSQDVLGAFDDGEIDC